MNNCNFPRCVCTNPATCSNSGAPTKAQRLARDLANAAQFPAYPPIGRFAECAAELRRMDANEEALVEALKEFAAIFPDDAWQKTLDARANARALITRIEAERNEK